MSSPFDLAHAEPTPFTARKKGTGINMNKREAFIAYLHEHGWMIDTEARVKVRRNGTYVDAQDPLTFVRPTADGTGVWRLRLDYTVEGSYSYRTDNTLRGLTLTQVGSTHKYTMVNSAQKKLAATALWDVTGRDLETTSHALRRRAERVAANPDLAVWLVEERMHQSKLDAAKRQREWEAQRAKAQAHNPALREDVSNRDFARLAQRVRDLSYELQYGVDGTTDIPERMARFEDAVAELRKAVV